MLLRLTAATVGIAFGPGSDVTSEAAAAVILDNSLKKVDELLHIGRRMRDHRPGKRGRRYSSEPDRCWVCGRGVAAARGRGDHSGSDRHSGDTQCYSGDLGAKGDVGCGVDLSCKQQFTEGGRDVEIGFRRFGGTPGEIAAFGPLPDAAKKIAGPDISFAGECGQNAVQGIFMAINTRSLLIRADAVIPDAYCMSVTRSPLLTSMTRSTHSPGRCHLKLEIPFALARGQGR